ncbi:MAG: GMC family oxidoreductase N-terminal domain-containing protein [Rhodobacteraceae bacterium]|nr:GMC family oxidoreductase N-terminal domain-containing protein [Paracoccaceae bacterium]
MAFDPDVVIVGGGSSGSVLAARLVGDFGAKVLLLEAGPSRGHWMLDLPAGYMKFLASDRFLEFHESTPQRALGGRSLIVPQARILGGGSAVNAMVYMRGQPEDYEAWAEAAASRDWSFEGLLPHFKAVEGNAELGDPWHGKEGPLKVSHLGHHNEVSLAFLEACAARGIPLTDDFNGAAQAGAGFMQHTIDRQSRRRSSVVGAFLEPLKRHPDLRILSGSEVRRILVEGGRAVGVEYAHEGQTEIVRAASDVVLCAGALATPLLLMRSGIGPADHLRDCGIDLVLDNPAIGANLQDHCEAPVVATLRRGLGYFGQDKGLAMLRHGVRYLLTRSGPVTSTGVEACAFVTSGDGARADLQIYCVPTVYLDRTVTGAEPTWGVTLNSCLLRPKSRGTIRLDPSAPESRSNFEPGYLDDTRDMETILRGLEICRSILRQAPLSDMVVEEILPKASQSDGEALRNHVRSTVKTNYHPVGTAALGTVVDARLRVHGLDSLRIADASVMPTIPSGNTNAPVIAVAHKAAALLR